MSFFKKLQNMLGFGYSEDEDPELLSPLDRPVDIEQMQVATQTPRVKAPDQPLQASPQMVYMIFEKVVEVTNASVPQYLQSSLDPERQRQFLYEALDVSIKDYLQSLQAQAQAQCEAQWCEERDKLKQEMDTLKQRAADLEQRRTEINEQKLSAERQRRALVERVRDLESNVQKLEAEREQLEIENRGLINKAKVANVYESDIEEMRQQIERMKNSPETVSSAQEITKLNEIITDLHAEIDSLNEALEAARVKDSMSEAMIKDLQKRASEGAQRSKDQESEIVHVYEEIKLLEAKIEDLQKAVTEKESLIAERDSLIAEKDSLIAEKDARIAEDEESFEDIQTIVEQIEMFEKVKAKLQDHISHLKGELQDAKRQLVEAQAENENLKNTIRTNLYAHAQHEKSMIDQIERLRAASDRGE